MAMKRPRSDARVVKSLVKKTGNPQLGVALMEMPLIYLQAEDVVKLGTFASNLLEERYGTGSRPAMFYARLALTIFKQYGFNAAIYIPPLYFLVEYNEKREALEFHLFGNELQHPHEYCFSFDFTQDLQPQTRIHTCFMNPNTTREEAKAMLEEIDSKYSNEKTPFFTGMVQQAITCIMSLMLWLENSDKHAVAVRATPGSARTPEQKKKVEKQNKLKPWLREDAVTIEFLDELPVERETRPHQGGTHASPRPHARRGHFRTLNSEKYRHHPLFGVHKGVYVKPSYVGPLATSYRGKEYRICRPNRPPSTTGSSAE